MICRFAILAAPLAVAACAPIDAETEVDPALAGPAVEVVGEGRSCLNLAQIRNSRVRSDQVIDFEMRGGDVYRSVLPTRCPRLGFERAFTYDTSLTQLCRQDIIYTLEQIGGSVRRGAGCGLGEFVPVEYVEDEGE
ncbi:hypothetical protein [Erythrobacter sp.]|jgi:hypothetical protein|uniref:hypothetical protein n=1 Tax=Erythrobacter sp. TaxID=1042 RepID=UPI002EB310AE|nr:hypothetical protein [Erythrobacter sp.]